MDSFASRQFAPPGGLILDHVAHFVPELGDAARALEALGFAVTPESVHQTQDGPAGTSNVCVMLEHGYLEFLTPTVDTPNSRRVRASMQRYAGVHLACFGTPDAEGEQARLQTHGFEPRSPPAPAGRGSPRCCRGLRMISCTCLPPAATC